MNWLQHHPFFFFFFLHPLHFSKRLSILKSHGLPPLLCPWRKEDKLINHKAWLHRFSGHFEHSPCDCRPSIWTDSVAQREQQELSHPALQHPTGQENTAHGTVRGQFSQTLRNEMFHEQVRNLNWNVLGGLGGVMTLVPKMSTLGTNDTSAILLTHSHTWTQQLQGLLLTGNDKSWQSLYHGNTGRDARIGPQWDTGPSQGSAHTLIHV